MSQNSRDKENKTANNSATFSVYCDIIALLSLQTDRLFYMIARATTNKKKTTLTHQIYYVLTADPPEGTRGSI